MALPGQYLNGIGLPDWSNLDELGPAGETSSASSGINWNNIVDSISDVGSSIFDFFGNKEQSKAAKANADAAAAYAQGQQGYSLQQNNSSVGTTIAIIGGIAAVGTLIYFLTSKD